MAFLRLKGYMRLTDQFRDGNVSESVESRMFCEMLNELERFILASGKLRE